MLIQINLCMKSRAHICRRGQTLFRVREGEWERMEGRERVNNISQCGCSEEAKITSVWFLTNNILKIALGWVETACKDVNSLAQQRQRWIIFLFLFFFSPSSSCFHIKRQKGENPSEKHISSSRCCMTGGATVQREKQKIGEVKRLGWRNLGVCGCCFYIHSWPCSKGRSGSMWCLIVTL